MADEGQVIRGINWRQTFPFVHIFRSFRVAIHPSKLILGFALLVTVYVGGRILDKVWLIHERAVPGEIDQYKKDPGTLSEWRKAKQDEIDARLATDLYDSGIDAPSKDKQSDEKAVTAARAQAEADAKARDKIDDLEKKVNDKISEARKEVDDEQTKAHEAVKSRFDASDKGAAAQKSRDEANIKIDKGHTEGIQQIYVEVGKKTREIDAYRGEGIFSAFFGYELNQINKVVDAVKHSDWLTPDGVLDSTRDFFTVGPVWLMWNHSVFAILFGLLFLFAWSLFGGAISRIAAVHVARDEKISVRQAMNFAVGKFLSFASAPVIPILIVVVIGLIVTVGSLLGNIPFLGPILVGALFFLALLAGFVMTLVLLGTAGGFNLMYPTIAVEGSDSFDAISRSFSYVYARPWRMLFYTAVAIAYGAATYIFIHMFIWTMLAMTHHFVGMGIFTDALNHKNSLDMMWPTPENAQRLTYSVDYHPLKSGEAAGAFLIQMWVMLLVSFLGAFAISLYFSANSIIYYLMRAEVDATEMDDVYLEQSDEDFVDNTPAAVPSPAPAAPITPAPDAPTA